VNPGSSLPVEREGGRGARISAAELVRSAGARAVIFDMDGVLADTEEHHLESWRVLLSRRFGLLPAPEVIRATFGQSNERILPILLPPGTVLGAAEMALLSEEKEAAYRDSARGRVRPLPGVEDFLRWLRRKGIPAAVGTSGPPENVRFILEEFGWRGLFAALVDRSSFAASKPAPDCFLEAAARLGALPGRCLVFEDSLHGLTAARRAGAAAAAIATTYPEEVIAPFGRWTFRDFTEIAC
jgi:beta-phosphoglucomutase